MTGASLPFRSVSEGSVSEVDLDKVLNDLYSRVILKQLYHSLSISRVES